LGIGCGGDGDPVLARVGDREIRASDYIGAHQRMKSEDRPPLATLEEKRDFLEDLVNKEVMEVAAFEKYPDPPGRQAYRLERTRQGKLTDMASRALIRERCVVTEEMKDRVYEDMKRERHLKGMLILDPDAARYVAEQLRAGSDFGMLAADYSAQWAAEPARGDLGWAKPGKFPYPVDVAVWDAEVGSLVGPIESSRGNYLIQVVDERPAEVTQSREEMDALLYETIMQELYFARQKFVQDSLRAAVDVYYPPEGKALLMMKYHFEIPEDQVDNPFAKLDAARVTPTFMAAEESVVVVDFEGIPDWTAAEFRDRLSWYPTGMWPTGQSEEELVHQMDIMIREFLYLKAARDMGLENEEFEKEMDLKVREMRVNYYYNIDLRRQFAPDSAEIAAFFEENRESYRAPPSYKISFFGSGDKEAIGAIVREWKEGASFRELVDKYEKTSTAELLSIGESEWLYEGDDPFRDDLVATLREGGVSDVVMRTDAALAVKLIARRPSRLVPFAEIRDQVEKDATTVITDRRFTEFLDERRREYGVKVYERALEKLEIPPMEGEEERPVTVG
jgi:hypothetical protein